MVKRIYLELTNNCNMNCSFCRKSTRKSSELSLSTVEKVMQESMNITEYFYLHVQGEPLMYPYLEEVFTLADNYKRRIQLVTNGKLIKEKENILLTSSSLRKLSISLAGLFLVADAKDKLRAMESFIERARNHDFVVELRLLEDEERIIAYIKDKFYPQIIKGVDAKIRDNLYLSFKKKFNWPEINQKTKRKSSCIGPKMMLCILSDGTITPCCLDSEGLLSLGNINEISLSQALKSARYQRIIQGFKDNKVVELLCQGCDYGDNQ